jgi:hypothetical protein
LKHKTVLPYTLVNIFMGIEKRKCLGTLDALWESPSPANTKEVNYGTAAAKQGCAAQMIAEKAKCASTAGVPERTKAVPSGAECFTTTRPLLPA